MSLLYKHSVKYLIVGGEAVIYYGYARLTGDIDIFYERTFENIKNLYNALNEFWRGNIPGIEKKEELMEEGIILQFGVPPNRIDLLNKITGVSFSEAWENKKCEQVKSRRRTMVKVYYIGLNELIKNKEALTRPKDLEDLKYLKTKI